MKLYKGHELQYDPVYLSVLSPVPECKKWSYTPRGGKVSSRFFDIGGKKKPFPKTKSVQEFVQEAAQTTN